MISPQKGLASGRFSALRAPRALASSSKVGHIESLGLCQSLNVQLFLVCASTARGVCLREPWVRWTMKRKVAQRETQRAYPHARLKLGSVECNKVRRTGQTPISSGSAEIDVALLPSNGRLAAIAKPAHKAVKTVFCGTNRYRRIGPLKSKRLRRFE